MTSPPDTGTITVSVGDTEAFIEDQCRVVLIEAPDVLPRDRTIAVLRTSQGKWHAFRNQCPHRGGPLGLGTVRGTMLPSDPGVFDYGLHNRLLVCPWHKREFDIETGECMYVDSHLRLVKYPIRVQNGKVLLELFSIPPETTGQVPSLPKRRAEQS